MSVILGKEGNSCVVISLSKFQQLLKYYNINIDLFISKSNLCHTQAGVIKRTQPTKQLRDNDSAVIINGK